MNSERKAEVYNRNGMSILRMECDHKSENWMIQEIRRLQHLRLHSDAQAGLAYDHGWPVLEAYVREAGEIAARIEELQSYSANLVMFEEAVSYFRLSAAEYQRSQSSKDSHRTAGAQLQRNGKNG